MYVAVITASIACVATVMLTGVIWFVQVVHYPLFRLVGAGSFIAFERVHTRRISYIVVPLMVTEMSAALVLPFLDPVAPARGLAWVGAVLAILIWLVTFTVQVPLHRRLLEGYDAGAVDRLVKSNGLRVGLWSARAVVSILLLEAIVTGNPGFL